MKLFDLETKFCPFDPDTILTTTCGIMLTYDTLIDDNGNVLVTGVKDGTSC
jgi:hypothetical protein